MSIFQTPAPPKATDRDPAVTPMTAPMPPPINPDPPGDVKHVPNADNRQR
jgi:hypothetical protein